MNPNEFGYYEHSVLTLFLRWSVFSWDQCLKCYDTSIASKDHFYEDGMENW